MNASAPNMSSMPMQTYQMSGNMKMAPVVNANNVQQLNSMSSMGNMSGPCPDNDVGASQCCQPIVSCLCEAPTSKSHNNKSGCVIM